MKKVEGIELLQDGESIGYTPIIKIKGKKKFGLIENNKPLLFKTKKDAEDHGLEYLLHN